jgi:membrane associated rhomboid family serine protease
MSSRNPFRGQKHRVPSLRDPDIAKDLSYRWVYHVWDRASVSWFMHAFLHGGLSHLLFNMLFLWLAGSAIEDRWGRIPFVIFYLSGATAAALAFKLVNPNTAAGLVGASGAIAAAMGAFLVCCYGSHIRMLFFGYLPGKGFRTTRFWVPTYVALPAWFLVEAFWSWYEAEGLVSGTAHSAHMGGFSFGVAVALVVRLSRVEKRFLLRSEHVKDTATNRKRPVELERAEQFVASGSYSAAIDSLTPLFARDPTQIEAGVELVEIGLSIKDRNAVADHFGTVVGHLALKNDSDKLADLLSKGVPMGLHRDLSERAYAHGIHALLARDDLDTAKNLLSELLRAYPNSAFLPRLLWSFGDPDATRGDREGQREALTVLAERFPMDPFGQKASLALAELPEAPQALSKVQPAGIEPPRAHRENSGLPLLVEPGLPPSPQGDAQLFPAHPDATVLPPANPGGVELSVDTAALELSADAGALELSADAGALELSVDAAALELSVEAGPTKQAGSTK